jgi:drug/metabolite transporter (DMT)-like permease
MNKKESISLVTLLALGGLYLIWGSTFLSVRILLEFLPPLVISFSRNLVAGLLFLLWSFLGGHWRKLTFEHWKVHLLAGVLLITLGNGFMALAGQTIPSGLSSVFMAVGPLLLIIFFWISGRKPSKRKLVGTLIGFIGIILLASQKNLAIPGKEIDFFKGMGFLLVAVVAWNLGVFYIQFTKANTYHFTQVCGIQMTSGGLILLGIALFRGDAQSVVVAELPLKAIYVFTYLALIGSMLGFGLFGYLSKALDATLVSTYTYVNPIIALFLGNIILGESLSSILLFASSLILSAVLLITTEKTSSL